MPDEVVVPPVSPPPAAWYSTLDAETQAYVTNNITPDGRADPLKAFSEAAKAHQSAQQYIGVKPEQIIKLPGDDNPDAWKAVWQRLGAPADAAGYDLSGVKKADGTAIDAAESDWIRATAAKLNLPLSAAQALATEMTVRQEASRQEAATANAGRVAEQKTALRTQWAQNFEANEFVAKQAMAAFGLNAEQITQVENSPNVASAMETWRQIGMRIGEDKYIQGGGGGRPGSMTLGEAQGRKTELMADTDWRTRFLAGGSAEKQEMSRIDTIIATAAANG